MSYSDWNNPITSGNILRLPRCPLDMFSLDTRDTYGTQYSTDLDEGITDKTIHHSDTQKEQIGLLYIEKEPSLTLDIDIANAEIAIENSEPTTRQEQLNLDYLKGILRRMKDEKNTGIATHYADYLEAYLQPKKVITKFDLSYDYNFKILQVKDGKYYEAPRSLSRNESYELESIFDARAINNYQFRSQGDGTSLGDIKTNLIRVPHEQSGACRRPSIDWINSGSIINRNDPNKPAIDADTLDARDWYSRNWYGAMGWVGAGLPRYVGLAQNNYIPYSVQGIQFYHTYPQTVNSDWLNFNYNTPQSYEFDYNSWNWLRNTKGYIRRGLLYTLGSLSFRYGGWPVWDATLYLGGNPDSIIEEQFRQASSIGTGDFIPNPITKTKYPFTFFYLSTPYSRTEPSTATVSNLSIEYYSWSFNLLQG